MEVNGLGGGLFSAMDSGILGLEIALQQQQNPRMVSYPQPALKHSAYSDAGKSKQLPGQVVVSDDDDEPSFAGEDSGASDLKRKASPWQRMKWTDAMVRLLIMAVLYIGDEVVSETTETAGKKKPAGILQKKGKWKSVSRAMAEKGFHVSPQQCEDKFNDLNKRYKRVNEILGKGTACRVVENQALLDSMEISPKMKEEVRKLLNSKHLFFREMCAYHNSFGHTSETHHSPEISAATEPSPQQTQCFHKPDNPQVVKSRNVGYEEEEDDESESESYDEDDEDERLPQKRARRSEATAEASALIQRFSAEILGVMQDGSVNLSEKKQWLRARMSELEEQQVGFQYEAFKLEKQRLKWARFSGKKERDMDRAKVENERRRLENERMVLLIRQKELEVSDLRHRRNPQLHSSNQRAGDSITG